MRAAAVIDGGMRALRLALALNSQLVGRFVAGIEAGPWRQPVATASYRASAPIAGR